MDQVRTGELRLSAHLPFEFEPFAPPADIADLVHSFYAIRTEAGDLDEHIPAYSAQMLLFVEGSAVLRPEASRTLRTARMCCSTPLLRATPVTFHGPSWILGASLTALGWQALSGMSADKVNGRLIDGAELLDAGQLDALEALGTHCREGKAQPAAVFERMGDILRACRHRLDPTHVRLIGQITDWLASELTPPIAKLYSEAQVSDRTVQRVSRRFFGVSPSHLVKRVRAIRAAMLLANPDLPQSMRDAIIDAYFDQAHLIRDIRRYTGRTPTRLVGGTTVEDTLNPEAHGQAARLLRDGGK